MQISVLLAGGAHPASQLSRRGGVQQPWKIVTRPPFLSPHTAPFPPTTYRPRFQPSVVEPKSRGLTKTVLVPTHHPNGFDSPLINKDLSYIDLLHAPSAAWPAQSRIFRASPSAIWLFDLSSKRFHRYFDQNILSPRLNDPDNLLS